MKTIKQFGNLWALFLLMAVFSCGVNKKDPRIMISTELGDITLELYADKAPLTVANFLQYINEDRFKTVSFYRVVRMDNQQDTDIKIEVIQGGLFDDDHPLALPPIEHESTEQTGILHQNGVISMARYGPGTATAEFFICVGDQPSLDHGGKRNADGYGFAAFGKVITGMEVVKRIHLQPDKDQFLDPRIKIFGIKIIK